MSHEDGGVDQGTCEDEQETDTVTKYVINITLYQRRPSVRSRVCEGRSWNTCRESGTRDTPRSHQQQWISNIIQKQSSEEHAELKKRSATSSVTLGTHGLKYLLWNFYEPQKNSTITIDTRSYYNVHDKKLMTRGPGYELRGAD
ncbi:unnamed protein product [Danaus chrysippus]|uniref:(African queen) hypothetical protein n=1 Tax=Danaus chrysippus TaxID=151541 RepID=A0A8J2QTY2_9NEOP|nr:unnamed protein product [Danaus chrysippus]